MTRERHDRPVTRQSRWAVAALLALPIWLLPFGTSEGHGSGWTPDRAAECAVLACVDRPAARDLLDRVDGQVEAALAQRARRKNSTIARDASGPAGSV